MNKIKSDISNCRSERIIKKYQALSRQCQESFRMLETTFNSLTDMMISIHDLHHRIVKVNKAFLQHVNKPAEEVVGKFCYEIIHNSAAPIPQCPHAKCLQTGITESIEREDENHGRIYEVVVTPRRSRNGTLIGTVHVIKEITARKTAEIKIKEQNAHLQTLAEDLKKQTEKADAANLAKSRFLATMSHEIRTPLNGIVGMTCLLNETSLTPQQRKFTDIITTSSDALLSLINDILDVSRIEAGKLSLETVDFNLRDALENAIEVLSVRALEKQLRLGYVIAPLVPSNLRGDSGRLRQILINLVGNAIKFTHHGEVTVRVNLDSQSDDRVTLNFKVSDTGIGIPRDRLEDIFKPFVQVDGSLTRQYGGTGLGLTICKELVSMMGGCIGVESVIDEGSVFWFTATFEKQINQSVKLHDLKSDFNGMKTLIVDDHEMTRIHIMTLLQEHNFRYSPAQNGREALQLLQKAAQKKDPFQLALIEMNLPDINGEELAKQIKSNSMIAATQLISMNMLGGNDDFNQKTESPFFCHLCKPFRRSHLIQSIAAVVDHLKDPDKTCADKTADSLNTKEINYGTGRILIVEDNYTNQEVIRTILVKLGFQSDIADNGYKAIECIKNSSYDLVLMDCQMPELDGYETTKAIRALNLQSNTHQIPIIALTANALTEDRRKCLEAGMNDYLCKPVQPDELGRMLRSWIGNSAPSKNERQQPALKVGSDCFQEEDLLNRLMGDRKIAEKIIDQFIRSIPDQINGLNQSFAGRSEDGQRIAHSIKGASANIGAMKINEICAHMEHFLKEGKTEQAKGMMMNLQNEFEILKLEIIKKGYMKQSLRSNS